MNARDKNIESTRQNRRRLNRRAPNPLALEARLMFDGAAVATVAATEPAHADVAPAAIETTAIIDAVPVTDGAARDSAVASPAAAEPVEARQLVAGDTALTGGRREIAFVDSSIAQWRELADAIRPGVEVVLIDSGSDGLEQIAQYLQGRDDIDAVHILAHGSEADATFGSAHLTADSVAQYQDTLSRIGSALATDGDLLLYGCDIGKGAAGLGLIGQLAQATGADVAASSDLTGAAARGGDWVLEVGSGQIEAPVLDLAAYDGVLRTTQTATFGSASGDSSTPAIVSANVGFSGSGTLVINANDVDFSDGERDAVYIKDGNDSAYRKIYNSYGDNYLHGSNAADFSTTFTINQFDAGTMYIKVVGEVSGWVFRVNTANLTVFTNEAPVVTSTSLTTAEDTALTRSLSTLGSDADGDPLTYTLVSGPSHGTVSFTGGNMVYTPTAGYYGPDSFTYKANDGYLDSGVGTINLTVSSVNDAPVLGGTGALAYTENQAATAIFTGFTASDDGANFNGGYLQAQITTNGAAEDQLSVLNQGTGAGQIGVSGTTVTYGGTTIGTIDGVLNGANNTAIKIALNSNATAAATQALARAIAYRDTSDAPSTAARTVTYTLNDGGNTGSGGALSTTRTASISVAAVDDPAVLTLASAATYVENDSNFFVDPALTLTDVDSATLDGAKVVIGSGFKSAEDRLLPASGTTNGITYSYDQAKGVLTLSGTATIAQYEAALRAVKYNNISENPDQTPRTISFTLGNKVALTIGNVTHYYEAVSGPLSWTAAEAAAKARTFQGLTGYLATITSQAENDFIREKLTADAWIGATDSYTYINAATGTTTYASQAAAEGHWYWVSGPEAGTRISDGNGTPVTASGSYAYWNTGEPNNSGGSEHYGEIYSTGAAPGKWNDLPNSSTLAYVVEYSDSGGGSSSFSKSIVVTPQRVNDAPVTSGSVNLSSITENATTNSGQLVSSFMTATDPDTAAVTGIALTGLTAGTGNWQYSLDNGATWVAVGAVDNTGALLLRTTDRVRYVPDVLNADSASITYRAWDRTNENGTSIVAGQKVNVSTNGGTAAYSSGTQTGNLAVTAVNDAPTLTAAAPTLGALTEDDTANAGQTVASVLGASVADVDSGAVQGIAITSLNAGNGTWEYNTGSGWTAVGTVAGNSALLLRSTDQIRFRPDGMNGTAASFTYKAWDRSTGTQGSKVDASVSGGTTAFSIAADTASIVVSSVNDAPVLSGAPLAFSSISEDNTSSAGQTVASLLGATQTDVDSGAVKGVAIEGATLAGNGRWEYDSGSGWTAVGSVSSGSALLLRATDKIRFVPDTLVGGTATLTVRGWDTTTGSAGAKVDATTTGGTTAFSTASATASITVNSIDDTPSFADSDGNPALPSNKAFSEAAAGSPASSSVPTPVDTTLLLRDDGTGSSIKSATVTIAAGFTAGDVLAAVTTGTSITASFDAASGVLTLSGPDTVAHYQAVLRSVTFASTSDDPTVNSASRGLAWRVTDTTNLSSALITSLVTVTPTVDAPVLAGPASLDYTEDDGLRILAPTLTLADSDDTSQAGARLILSGSGLDKGTEYLTLRGASPTVNGSGEYAWTLTNVMGYTGVDASYSWDSGNGRGVLVISGTASTAAYQQILRTVSYANGTDYTVSALSTPTVGTRDVKWQLIDADSDGVGADSVSALLGSGAGDGSLSNEITQTLTLKNANEAPQVAGAGVVLSYDEGDTIKILANAIVPSDDNADGALSSARVQVTAGLTQGDLLAVAADSNASDGYTHTVSGNTVTLTWNGVQVAEGVDGITGFEEQTLSALPALVAGQVFTLTANGVVLTATLGPTPTMADLVTALQADSDYVLADFTVSDSGNNLVLTWLSLGDKPPASLVSTETVTASYDSATGVLDITGNASIAAYQSVLRSVTFGNTTNDDLTASSSTRTVQWRVVDSNGVPSAVDAGASTTIAVTAINDAPVVTPAAGTYTFTEGGPAIIANAGLALSDPDDTNATSAGVVISGAGYESSKEFLSFAGVTPATGSMAAGADWTATNVFGSGLDASFTAATGTLALTGTASTETYREVLRRVAYSNASDNPGSGTRTLTWTVGDGFASRLTDAAGANDGNAGTSTSVTSLITLSPRNDAPVLASGLGGSASYTEGAGAALLASAVTLADVDDTQLSGARVWISSGFTAGDALSVATPGSLTVDYDSSTGVLTLTGTASVAAYQAALQSLGFSSSSNDPTAISASRALSWQVTDADASGDGALASVVGASSLDITATDDAASVSGLPANGSITFTENASPVVAAPALTLADADDETLVSASVAITGGLTAGDVLALGGDFSAAGISATYDAGTGTLTLTGPASIADFQSALRAVTFSNTSNDPNASANTRSLSWTTVSAFASRLTDAPAGNDATGGSTSGAVTSQVSLTPLNDAPSLTLDDGTPSPSDAPVFEQGSTPVFAIRTGNTAGGVTITDPDLGDQIASASVRLSANWLATDVLSIATPAGWSRTGDVFSSGGTSVTATYNAGTGILSFSGLASRSDYETLLGHVKFDNSSVAPTASGASRELTWTVTDSNQAGDGARSATTTSQLIIRDRNDAPTVVPAAPAAVYAEGAESVSVPALTITDPDPGEIVTATLTLSDPAAGILSVSGGASYDPLTGVWTLSGTVANVNAALAALSFVPATDYDQPVTLSYHVADGGEDAAAPATGSVALNVTAANDAPVLTPASPVLPGLTEDDTGNAGVSVASFRGAIVDVDTGAQQGIVITDLASGNGTWQYSLDGGSNWLDVGSVTTASALALRDSDKLRFVPDGHNATSVGFTYRAWDRSSGSAGNKLDASSTGNATPFSSAADTASLTVGAVNDAPVLAAASPVLATLTENDTGNAGQSVASLLGSSIGDVDSGAQQGIAITGLDAGNGAWQYSVDDGSSWVTVSGVTAANALLLRSTDLVRFQPDTLNGTTASFDYKAWDRSTGSAGGRGDTTTASAVTGAFSATGNTASITATPVNDAPINDVLPSFSGGARGDGSLRQDGLLTAVPGQWHDVDAGSPATTFQYQWEVADDAAGTNLRVIDAATAASYQLTAAEIGKFVRVRVTGSDGEAETVAHSSFTRVSNEAPLLSNPLPLQEITQSVPLDLVLPADTFTDANPEDTLYFTATLADGSPLPAWLSFDPITRSFTGTPGGGDIGDLNIRVTVSDHGQRDATMDFTLRVLALPVKQADPVAPAVPAAPPSAPAVEASPVAPSDAGFIRASGNEGLSVTATDPVVTPQASAFVPPVPPVAARDTSAATTSSPVGGLTRSDGFQVVVAPAAASGDVALLLVRPLNDQVAVPTESIRIAVPPDTFSHTLREAVVSLSAQRTDGLPLPGWLRFDAQKGEFRGVAPAGFEGDFEVKVVAKDNFGNEVSTIFRFSVKPKVKAGFMGRDGLSAQLRAQSLFGAVPAPGERASLSGQTAERGAKLVGRGRVVG